MIILLLLLRLEYLISKFDDHNHTNFCIFLFSIGNENDQANLGIAREFGMYQSICMRQYVKWFWNFLLWQVYWIVLKCTPNSLTETELLKIMLSWYTSSRAYKLKPELLMFITLSVPTVLLLGSLYLVAIIIFYTVSISGTWNDSMQTTVQLEDKCICTFTQMQTCWWSSSVDHTFKPFCITTVPNKADFFCHLCLCSSMASVCFWKQGLSKDQFLIKKKYKLKSQAILF